jgi:hypothetical protein
MTKRWSDADGIHLDLTGLEAPAPMLAVVAEITTSNTPLILHMDREPIFFYPELEELGWAWSVQRAEKPGADEAAFVIHLQKADDA